MITVANIWAKRRRNSYRMKGLKSMGGIDFRTLMLLNIISDSGVSITEAEANSLMRMAQRNNCRICQEKVKAMARAAGLAVFDSES